MGRAKPIPAKNRKALHERSGGLCEGCGLRPATDVHHRKYLSRRGTHDLENLLALCGGAGGMSGGNHSGCHGVAHSSEGHELGWSVHSWDDPENIHVLYRGEIRWLTPIGTTNKYPPEERL